MSHVMRHVSQQIYIFFCLQIGEANQWRICYQRGLARLVTHLPTK